jgi:predicted nucleic acid-binding protein
VTLWLDASVVVSVMAAESTSLAVDRSLAEATGAILVSDFCVAETSAAIARLARTGQKSPADADRLFDELDEWIADLAERRIIEPEDVALAIDFVRQPGLSLRAPDAIHIAAAQRVGATLITLDKGMARAAALLGIPHLNPAEADAPGEPKD